MAGALSLRVTNLDAVVANLFAVDRRAQAGFRRAVDRAGKAVYGRAREHMLRMRIFRTGRMYDALRLRFTEGRLGYQVGWDAADFARAGVSFYPPFVVFGTTRTPARDPLFPAHEEVRPIFERDIRSEIRAALDRRGR